MAKHDSATLRPVATRTSRKSLLRAIGLVVIVATWACSPNDPTTSPTRSANRAMRDAADSAAAQPELIPGQYIITFADSVQDVPGLAKRIAAQYGHEPMFVYQSAIKGFAAQLPGQAVEALQRNPQIARVEQDAAIHVSDTLPGTETGADWGLDRLDQRTGLDNSYTYQSTGAGVSVYIFDTGIRTSHVDFGGRVVGGYSAISDGNGLNDCNGHGTHVAGTAGGTVYGVAKGVQLYSIRVLDCTGNGTSSGLLAGLDWVNKNRVLPAVGNMSLSGANSSTINSAVANTINAGVVMAVAAGNNGADACNYSPGSTAAALTVGATWNGDGMPAYSNFGACVDLFAPGSAIRSDSYKDDTSSVVMGGTSMASPHVAGVAALYLSVYPTATPSQVAAAIVNGATPNVLSSIPAGTANLLLYSSITGSAPATAASSPSTDTTSLWTPTPTPASDQPPTATFSVNCVKGKCTFDGSASTDDHGISLYTWSFGDGIGSTGGGAAKVVHNYATKGNFTVTLTVTDTAGQSNSKSVTVSIKKV